MTSLNGFSESYGFDRDPVSIPLGVFGIPQSLERNESVVSSSTLTSYIYFKRASSITSFDSTVTLTSKIYFARHTTTVYENRYRRYNRSQTNQLDFGKSTVSSRRTVYRRIRDEDGPSSPVRGGHLGANRPRGLESSRKNGFGQSNCRNRRS